MREKVKKLFLNSIWSKKQLILAVLFLVSVGLILPTYSAQAFAWLAGLIASALIIIALQALVAITSGILWLATAILSWVTSENFISIPYTSEGVVAIGWPLCRDFANMAIVVFLVFIGIATALRIGDYQAKKTLPVLIIVALLINFSPVICGLIIDATNIIMNFFLEEIKEIEHIYAHFNRLGEEILNALGEGGIVGFFELLASGLIIRPLIISTFNIGAAIIIFLFSFIFVLRYIALWTLVILSPLAFASYILPITRSFWNMWWNQFVQWSIIGIPMAFFLYLGWQIIGMIDQIPLATELPGTSEAPNIVALLLNDILPYFVVLSFLGLGFFIGLSSGAMGTNKILTGAKRGGQVAVKALGAYAASKGASWAKERVPERVRRLSGRLAGATAPRRKLTEEEKALPWYKRAPKILGRDVLRGVTAPIYTTGRAIGRAGLLLTEREMGDVKKAEDKAKESTPERNLATIRSGTRAQKIGALRGAIEAEQIKDLREAGLTDEDIQSIGKEALKIHPDTFKTIRNAFPQYAEEMGKTFSKDVRVKAGIDTEQAVKDGFKNVTERIMAKIKPANVSKIDEKALFGDRANPDVKKAMHKFWTGEQIGVAGRTLGRSFLNEFAKDAKRIGAEWYMKNNRRLFTYLGSSAAKGLGLEQPPRKEGTKKGKG